MSSIQMTSEYWKWSISLAYVLCSEDGKFYHLKTEHKLCPENDHLNTELSSLQMATVHDPENQTQFYFWKNFQFIYQMVGFGMVFSWTILL
jgi:hypothetical protein